MNSEIEHSIRQCIPWINLPNKIKQFLGNSYKEYEKLTINYSIKNQLRFKGNLVRNFRKDERKYYEDVLRYSREHLMLYPYHLSDVVVKGLRITPFAYYTSIMTEIMNQEKSYDSLPNFTAADCLRLMSIGRNQYIDIMNQCRSSKKFFRKKPIKDLLPKQPVETVTIETWWVVQAGYIVEDDIKMCTNEEKKMIDNIIDSISQPAGHLDYNILHALYRKGLVYLDVPINDHDHIIVPPLEGFVMNRVLGDYFETLLYKIFVSIDEHTSIIELSKVLEIDLQLVKNAVSMFCRLGFSKKKQVDQGMLPYLHESWKNIELNSLTDKKLTQDQLLLDWTLVSANDFTGNTFDSENNFENADNLSVSSNGTGISGGLVGSTIASNLGGIQNVWGQTISGETGTAMSVTGSGFTKRIGLLFDSTLTAFLMMGNLSPGLKSHAVTMFEVGKLNDESLDIFMTELDKVDTVAEGEAQRYFDHAITLRNTIKFLRHNPNLGNRISNSFASNTSKTGSCDSLVDITQSTNQHQSPGPYGLDLLRCESLLGLDPSTCSRVLNKNYAILVSVAPLSNEVRSISSNIPYHLGPAIPEVNSIWFKLYLYAVTGSGPPSFLLVKGTKLRRFPKILQAYSKVLVTTWGHDPAVVSTSNVLLTLNDALSHSALLVQGYSCEGMDGSTLYIPFPLSNVNETTNSFVSQVGFSSQNCSIPETIESISSQQDATNENTVYKKLLDIIDLNHACGFLTILKNRSTQKNIKLTEKSYDNYSVSKNIENSVGILKKSDKCISYNDDTKSIDSLSLTENKKNIDPFSFNTDSISKHQNRLSENYEQSASYLASTSKNNSQINSNNELLTYLPNNVYTAIASPIYSNCINKSDIKADNYQSNHGGMKYKNIDNHLMEFNTMMINNSKNSILITDVLNKKFKNLHLEGLAISPKENDMNTLLNDDFLDIKNNSPGENTEGIEYVDDINNDDGKKLYRSSVQKILEFDTITPSTLEADKRFEDIINHEDKQFGDLIFNSNKNFDNLNISGKDLNTSSSTNHMQSNTMKGHEFKYLENSNNSSSIIVASEININSQPIISLLQDDSVTHFSENNNVNLQSEYFHNKTDMDLTGNNNEVTGFIANDDSDMNCLKRMGSYSSESKLLFDEQRAEIIFEDGNLLENENWVLLDCCFGIPLFDSIVNKKVCHKIALHGLFHEESLKELAISNKKLTSNLLNFVQYYQTAQQSTETYGTYQNYLNTINYQHKNYDVSNNDILLNNSNNINNHHRDNQSRRSNAVLLPMSNLIFKNGNLSLWQGNN